MKNYSPNFKGLYIVLLFFYGLLGFGQTTTPFTSSGSWTVPAGVNSVTVEVWGAGGGGGGSSSNNNGGSGGGSGAYVFRTVDVTPGANIPFTIGTGGTAGVANGGNGGNGGSSSITIGGFTLTANGGNGGQGNAGTRGTGGTASGGTTNTTGNNGVTGGNSGGAGGNAPNGGTGGAGNTNGAGAPGNTPGGGGGGGEKANGSGGTNYAGGAGARGEIRFTYSPPGTYCTPTNTYSTSYYISGVSTTGGVANINNTGTGFSAYTDYSANFVSQYPGSSFSISATHPSSTYGYNVWIDWNNDGDFADAGENVISTGYLSTPASLGTVTIPGGQATGNYRMRIRNAYLSNPAPACGSHDYGEAEDYTVRVIAPPTCSGTPTAGTTTTNPISGSPGSNYTVSATGFTIASGLTYQWQYSTNGGSTWTNQGAATSSYSNYTATAPGTIGTTIAWRLVVTCTASSQSSNSSTSTFTVVSTLNVPTTGSNTVACGTNITLYDNGGPGGNYVNNSSGYTVLEAGLGGIINISGSYSTESGWDYIRIYDGTGTGGTLLNSYSGTGTINYTGTAGQTLTIQFTSDSGTVSTGFSLAVSYSGVCFPACSGTPTGGTVSVSPVNGGPGSSYTVSATGMTLATGMTYQWQSNTNNAGWVNVGTSSSTYSNYNATAPGTIGTTVQWQLVVTCTNSGLSATSSTSTFTVVSTLNVPQTGSNTVACGTNITLYDNGGPGGNYVNNSSGYTVLEAGLGASITLSGTYITESIDKIRIYNGTGTGGTLLAEYSGNTGGTINYAGAPGQTLTVQFYSDSSVVYGGFQLAVTYSGVCFPVCSGTPIGGTAVTTNPNSNWPGSIYTVSATGMTLATGMTYQWQYSTDAGATWTNAGAATSSYANYTATAPAAGDVHWQLVVTCTNGGQSANSATGIFVTMAVSGVTTGCPNVVSGGLGLNGADPAPFDCTASATCVELEATYLDLGNTTDYIVEPIAYNPPFAFGGLANPVSVNTDDVWSPTVNLPFDFCFYGVSYNKCLIGSNGVITFDTTNNTPGGTCSWSFDANLPVANNSALVENAIFGVFHDINPGVSGEVGWELITLQTGCRALVASWNNVPLFGDNSQFYTGMMVLYENSNIIEVYIKDKPIDPDSWNDNNAIVGIQNASGTMAAVAPGRNGLDADWTTTNEAWRFVPNGTSIASIAWYEGPTANGPVLGTDDILNVCPTATTTYTAEITYTLCDGRTIKETDTTTVTVNGAKTWNGSVNTDWNVANNWTPSGVPTATDCVVIADTANDPIVSGTNYNGLGLNLTIQNNALLTVASDNAVTITDWVNINTSGDLHLNNSASLIQINNDVNQGIMRMDRTTYIRKLDYVYWSSPVSNFSINSVSPGTSGFKYKWVPTIGSNTNGFGNWVGANEVMEAGKGYIVRGPNTYTSTITPYTAMFSGTPNNGIITLPIARGEWNGGTYVNGVSPTLGTNDDDNWNLIGNPYPSAIKAIDFLTANPNIEGFINIWTHGNLPSPSVSDPFYNDYVYNYTSNDYITYNATGASTGPATYNGFIPAGQGFFVLMKHTSASTNEQVTFTNNMRSHLYDNGQFFRSSNSSGRIWLDLISGSQAPVRSLVGYVPDATYSKDRLYDAKTNEKNIINLYSLIDNAPHKIQGRSLPFDENDQVPIGFKVPQTGIHSIAIGALDGFFTDVSQAIYLEDLDLNIIHDLRVAPYSFTANAGTYNDRFVLRYTNETLGNNDFINDNSVMVISNTNLSVVSIQESIQSVLVFDVLGRLLVNKQNTNSLEVPLHEVQKNNAPLVVQITLTNGTKINKKVVY